MYGNSQGFTQCQASTADSIEDQDFRIRIAQVRLVTSHSSAFSHAALERMRQAATACTCRRLEGDLPVEYLDRLPAPLLILLHAVDTALQRLADD